MRTPNEEKEFRTFVFGTDAFIAACNSIADADPAKVVTDYRITHPQLESVWKTKSPEEVYADVAVLVDALPPVDEDLRQAQFNELNWHLRDRLK